MGIADKIELTAPEALRALAHPLRIQILSLLQQGEATSTTVAEALGESTGATSYHLRQLARYGLVTDVPGRGNGRDRWWRAAARHVNVAPSARLSPEARSARAILLTRILARDTAVVAAFVENRDRYPKEWQDAGAITNHVLYLTAGELAELSARVADLLAEYGRPDPHERPPGAERVFGVLHLVPWKPELSRLGDGEGASDD